GREDHLGGVGALEDLLQVPPVDQLQRQEVAPGRHPQVQDLDDVPVLQAHRNVSLVEQHVAELGIGRILREDALEDDVLLEPLRAVLDAEEDLRHATVGQLAEDGVSPVQRHQSGLRYHPPMLKLYARLAGKAIRLAVRGWPAAVLLPIYAT